MVNNYNKGFKYKSGTLLAQNFAEWAINIKFNDIPNSVIHDGKRALLDTIGVTIAGSNHEKVKAISSSVKNVSGKCLIARNGKASAIDAALINGMAAHVLDYDDTSYTGMIHGSAIIFPAIFSASQSINANNEEMMTAFIVGSEISYALGEFCTLKHFLSGWWSTGSCALIGTTAAVCHLYGLDDLKTADAIGMAAVSSGIARAIAGTDTKPYLIGNVASQAINFANAAKAGLTGPLDAFEQENGFFKMFNSGYSKFNEITNQSNRWRMSDPGLFFKTSPVCSAAHSGIELISELISNNQINLDDITEINAEVPKMVFDSLVYKFPENSQQAQFSLPYCLACSAIYGSVRLKDIEPNEIHSPKKKIIMNLVTINLSSELSSDDMRIKFPESTRLTIKLKNGQQLEGFCGNALGMPSLPLSDEMLINKFESCLDYTGIKYKNINLENINILKLAKETFAINN